MYVMDQATADKIVDIHRGLHVAMTALITKKDIREAELVLHQMDAVFGELIRETHVANVR